MLATLLKGVDAGTYLDIGSNDPVKESNTFLLYLQGWKGINIDLNEKLIKKTCEVRPRDISIVAAVSDKVEKITMFRFDDDCFSTIDAESARKSRKNSPLLNQTTVTTKTIDQVLREVPQAYKKIDLLSIDVEGIDVRVLKSIDYTQVRPKVIVIEDWDFAYSKIGKNEIISFLQSKGYVFYSYFALNLFFIEDDFLKTASHLQRFCKATYENS